jgi:hypothetical protein
MQRQFGLQSIVAATFTTLAECFSSDLRSGRKKCRGNIAHFWNRPAKGELAILASVQSVVPIP